MHVAAALGRALGVHALCLHSPLSRHRSTLTTCNPLHLHPLQARPWRLKRMAVDAGEEEAAPAEAKGRGRALTTAEQEEADMERFLQVRFRVPLCWARWSADWSRVRTAKEGKEGCCCCAPLASAAAHSTA